jgi:peroxiredoxin
MLFKSLAVSGALLVTGVASVAWGQTAETEPQSLRQLLQRQQQTALRELVDYVARHPQADDADDARTQVLNLAVTTEQEQLAVELAEGLLTRPDLDPQVRGAALRVTCLGAARQGDLGKALAAYTPLMRTYRVQMPFPSLEVAGTLAARAQLAGEPDRLREVYDAFLGVFALNFQATEIVENRQARLKMLGQPAPQVDVPGLDGQPLTLAGLRGQVVLVDFWATNCAPCLADLPALRDLYRQYHERGLEIVGYSFADSRATVEAFVKQQKMPWKHAMNGDPLNGVCAQFQTRSIPATFLIDREGKIAYVDLRRQELQLAVEKLLK